MMDEHVAKASGDLGVGHGLSNRRGDLVGAATSGIHGDRLAVDHGRLARFNGWSAIGVKG